MKTFIGESDKRLRALVENILDVVTILSLDGTYEFCSSSVQATLGYTPDELEGKNAFALLHPADLPKATKLFSQILLNPKENFSTILRYRHKNGSWRWLEGVAVNRLSDPEIRGVVVNYRDITSRKREEEKTQQRVDQMTVLYKTTQDLVMERNQNKLLQKIVERAVTLLSANSGGLYLCEPEQFQVRCVVSYRTDKDFTSTVLKYGEGAAGKVAETGNPLIIDDYRTWSGRANIFEKQGFSAVLGVPIIYQGDVIGVLDILDDAATRKFNESDLKVALLFANQAAIAVTNARLIEQVQNHSAKLEQRTVELAHSNTLLASLHRIAAGLVVNRGRNEILDILSTELNALNIGHEITLYDPETDELVVEYVSLNSTILKKIERLFGASIKGFRGSANTPFIAELLESGYPLFMDDAKDVFFSLPFGIPKRLLEKFYKLAMGGELPMPTIFIPMKIGERKVGVMAVWGRDLRPQDADIFLVFVSQITTALENSRLLALEHQQSLELAHSNNLLDSLHHIVASLMVSQGRDEIINILSRELKHLGFGHEITLYDSGTNEFIVEVLSVDSDVIERLEKLPGIYVKGFRIPADIPFIVELFETGNARFMEDSKAVTLSIPLGIPKWIVEKSYELIVGKSSMPAVYLPIKIGARKIGLMAIWGEDLRPQDADTFLVFVAQVGVALENSRLLDSERQHSRELAHSNNLLESLHSIAAGLTVSRGNDETLNLLSTELKRLEIGHGITLYDPETNELVSQYVSVEFEQLKKLEKFLGVQIAGLRVGHQVKGIRTPANIPFLAELLETGSARFVSDFLEAANMASVRLPIPKALLPSAMKLIMGVSSIPIILLPLKVQERKIGLMAVWGRDLKPEDVDIFVVFVTQVAIALDNNRFIDAERQRANELEYKVNERTSQLSSLLQEKEILLREVYHRVKNNLQVINSLLGLQTSQLETDADRQVFVDTRERVKAMALVHEKLYQSGDLARVDFTEYVQGLVGNLARIYASDAKDVDIKINVGDVWLGLDTAIPCGLILNELIANTFKHAFPNPDSDQKPEIIIDLHAESDDKYVLVVADNGVGMSRNLDWRNTQSMGLQLVTMLTEQLDAELHLTRSGGTKFVLSFSEVQYKERS